MEAIAQATLVNTAKKTRLRRGGTLTQAEGSQIVAEKDAEAQIKRNKNRNGGGENEGPATARKFGKCGKIGHNARTCQIDEEISNVYSSD